KSTGREVFHLGWVEQQMSTLNLSLAPQDLLATLLALTVETIAIEIKKYANQIYEVFICGGGAHNKTFMEQLSKTLSHDVQTTQTLGISPDWIEGILFAWLARRTTHGLAGNIPTVTGATQAVSLGAIYPGNIGSFTPKKSTNHSINR